MELGTRVVAGAFTLTFRITEGVASLLRPGVGGTGPEPGPLELRRLLDGILDTALGVVESPEGNLSLLFGGFAGVLAKNGFAVSEASDIGGDGGVGVSDTVSTVETGLRIWGTIDHRRRSCRIE